MNSSWGDYKIIINKENITIIQISTGYIVHKIFDNSDTYTDVNYIWFQRNFANWIAIRDRSIKSIIFINLDTHQSYKFNTGRFFTIRVYYNLSSISPDGNTLIINGSFGNYSYEYLIFDITDLNRIYQINCRDLDFGGSILKDIDTGYEMISYDLQDIIITSYKTADDQINGKIYLSVTIRKEHHIGIIVQRYCSAEYFKDHKFINK